MATHSTPHFHNQPGVPQVRVGAKEFMCVGALPPFDHPHIFIDMGENNDAICPYCSTHYVYDEHLHGGCEPAECAFAPGLDAESGAEETAADGSLLSKIEPSKVIDLIVSKQTQYYTLWGVYTAVQFSAGSYGYGHPLRPGVGLAVLFGVWAFNLGHLGFVLQCVAQLKKLSVVLNAALDDNRKKYQSALQDASEICRQGACFGGYIKEGPTGEVIL
jgi:uncharacterized Zn-finger protein